MRVAVAGLGGFAQSHHEALLALEHEGICQVVATCDPAAPQQGEGIDRFHLRERGVQIHANLTEMLAAESLDVVTLPTPIPLHAKQHRQVVEAGLACYLEKPPTLWWPEYRQMLSIEEAAKHATNVGFNFVGDPLRHAIKERILSGEFGAVEGATLLAVWPRDTAYYGRSLWAGRLWLDGQPVFDSPIGNAVGHFVQDLLYWCGEDSLDSVAEVDEAAVLLFRAHPIESFDTCFLSSRLRNGRWLRIGATHTGFEGQSDRETVHCEKATILFNGWANARIEHQDGRVEVQRSAWNGYGAVIRENLHQYFDYLSGRLSRPVCRLIDCEGFVALNALAHTAEGGIQPFPIRSQSNEQGCVHIEGLEQELWHFVATGEWPYSMPEPASVSFTDLGG